MVWCRECCWYQCMSMPFFLICFGTGGLRRRLFFRTTIVRLCPKAAATAVLRFKSYMKWWSVVVGPGREGFYR